jgi:hypothetical protein
MKRNAGRNIECQVGDKKIWSDHGVPASFWRGRLRVSNGNEQERDQCLSKGNKPRCKHARKISDKKTDRSMESVTIKKMSTARSMYNVSSARHLPVGLKANCRCGPMGPIVSRLKT